MDTPQPEQTTPSALPAQPVATKKRPFVIAAIVCIIGIVAAVYFIVYGANEHGRTAKAILQAVPLPVAYVNGDFIPFRELESNVEAAQYFFGKQKELGVSLVEQPDENELRSSELERLVQYQLLQQYAEELGVSVSQQDIDDYFNEQIIPQAEGGVEEVETTLNDLYGWTTEEFKSNILTEVVLRETVSTSLSEDPAFVDDAKQRAQALHDEIVTSEKEFSEFATEFSEDTYSAADGGMLGFFGKGTMVPEFEEAAFALSIGEVSQPVQTRYGFHIIKVTNTDEAAGTIEARHILIAVQNLDELIQQRRDEATIKTWLNGQS